MLLTFVTWKAPYSSSKMCLFGNSKELQLGTCGLTVTDEPGQRKRCDEGSFMDVRGAIVNEEGIVNVDIILIQGSCTWKTEVESP